ncbi:RAMP superfamily CRISPR-associated protein [Propionibacterium australiense]|nr:RAMP superfamily CRISPR-associated protein [Propionibacterium australiense]SYZ32979.1 RAMP_I_III [Propionibacterium australiense]VEH92311.1 Uncharacterised protein [Propionibacterium australiense]
MIDLTMKLAFGSSVRMGTGYATNGLDEVIDDKAPLTASGIKGVLRDEARLLLAPTKKGEDISAKDDHPFVTAVFGGPSGRQCPWNFDIDIHDERRGDAGRPSGPGEGQNAAEPNTNRHALEVTSRASLRLDDTGSIVDGALLVKEEAWIGTATLRLFQRDRLCASGLPESWQQDPEMVRQAHLALISVAARLVDKVGQRKTRGMGWVEFLPDPQRPIKEDLEIVRQIMAGQHAKEAASDG